MPVAAEPTAAALAHAAAPELTPAIRRAIDLVAIRGRSVGAAGEIPSPCISVCQMNARADWCEGCFRTRAEIAQWSSADDSEKRQIWNMIEQRMADLQAGAAKPKQHLA